MNVHMARAEHLERLGHQLYKDGHIGESDMQTIFGAAQSYWDDALHFASPWDGRVSMCGNWGRNLIPLDELGDVGGERCWTCLQIRDWLYDHSMVPA